VNLRSKKTVMLLLAAITVVGLAGGAFAAYLSRHDTICPDGKPPLAQRSELIGQTEYKCRGGIVVKK
jgi:hypothetical protein